MKRTSVVVTSRWRVLLTVAVTVLVVLGEFAALWSVYQRGASLRPERAAVATFEGRLADATAAALPELQTDVAKDVAELARSGLSGHDLTGVRSAAAALSDSKIAPVDRIAELRDSVADLGRRVTHRQDTIDTESAIIYASLLILASFGWMIWFRRLVAKHRSLERELTEQQSRAEGEQRLAALVRNAADVVMVCDLDATVTFVTPSVKLVLGIDPAVLIGSSCVELVDPADRTHFLQLLSLTRGDEDAAVSVRMRHEDGRLLDVAGTVTNLIAEPSVGGLVVTIRDDTARVQLEAQLTHQAFHDSLTSLANRQLFSDRLSHALEQRDQSRQLAVLFCDLDEFKNVNDSLGHGMGDFVLQEVGKRAVGCVRVGDTVARFGGDEFAILLEEADLDLAQEIAQRLLEEIRQPISGEDGSIFHIRVSIGIATAAPGTCSGEDILRNADVAMYLAKDRGKGTIAVYEPELHAQALEGLALRGELQNAIRSEQLLLHFQPTINLASGRVAGFEALVRWEHPVRGLIPPNDFIPMAEQTGLILPLGSWVLRRACEAAVLLLPASADDGSRLTMSINVASAQLARDDFVAEVLGVLADTGFAARQLILEITESVFVHDVAAIVEKLKTLRTHGIQIAIDDFGTGYSSLAYLRNLPLDVLKVDKAFVDHVATNKSDATLAQTILTMSASMELKTVAEGVEDGDQAGWLAEAHCGYGQGFLWSRPLPLEQAKAFLADTKDGLPEAPKGTIPSPATQHEASQPLR